MGMDNIFMHDAVPTWSGFLYQGRIAVYLAVRKINELRKVLESYGYEMNAPKSGSSHYTFRKQGCMPITIPKHEPIKKIYVEMVR